MVRLSGWIAAACAAALVLSCGTAAGREGRGAALSAADRAAIARADAGGAGSVSLLLDAVPGRTGALARSVVALGGSVRFRDDRLGYLRVEVGPARAGAVASLPGLLALGLDRTLALADGPDETTGPLNPFLPTQDIGAPQFTQEHPTYDGRGVTIGILDTGVDPTRPELRTATDLQGHAVPKLVDWVATTDPQTDGDGSWVQVQNVVAGHDGAFSAGGRTYTAPAPGRYGFGVFREGDLCPDPSFAGGCEMENDVNRDGDSDDAFGVLVGSGGTDSTVWVDTNQDGSFADSKPMRAYRIHHDVDFFGNAAVDTDRVPYVVQVERNEHGRFVDIGIVSGGHGTHLAGIAAGAGFFGSQMDGVAPGAQLASVRACRWPSGCPSHALVEGMIYLAQTVKADVINLSVGSLPLLNDGNTPRCDLYARLIQQTGAQIFVAAGNSGPGGGTIDDPATCDDVVSVAAYQSAETWGTTFGIPTKPDTLWSFSARGPREDGGLAPTVSAPGGAISTWPAWDPPIPGQPPFGISTLPPGYQRFQGTSMAAPMAAGAAALLLSAAKQEHLHATPAALRQALVSGARFLPGYGPDAQGNGLVQVGAAWDVLRQGIRPVEIDSTARVATSLSSFLASPDQGRGLYVREGWAAGEGGTETITFEQHGGGSATYDVRWLGDPAFSSAGSITLQPGRAVPLEVDVAPLDQGVHSAIVQLDDPSTPGVDYETMATIDAALVPAAPDWSVSASGTVDRTDAQPALVVRVPEHAGLLRIDYSVDPGGRVRPRVFTPDGVEATAGAPPFVRGPGASSITIDAPAAGTWEIDADSSQTQAADSGGYTFTATVSGAAVEPATATALPQDFTIENLYAPLVSPDVVGTDFASALARTPTIADGETQTYDVDIPAGATSLSVRIGEATQPSSDLDLLLSDCTSGSCLPVATSAGGTSEESVSVPDPAPGRWQVTVVGAFVPAGSTGYSYLDSWTSPALGSIAVTPVSTDPWVVHAEAVSPGDPGAGRFLQGFVQVEDGGAVVGRAEVDLG